jgi:hypothetical protein
MTAPATKFGGPKSPPIASKAIFTESNLANFGVRFKAKIWGAQAARLFSPQLAAKVLQEYPARRSDMTGWAAEKTAPQIYFPSTVKTCRPL